MNVKVLCNLPTVITVYGGIIDYLFGLQTIYSIFSAGEHIISYSIHTFHYFLGKFFMDQMIGWGTWRYASKKSFINLLNISFFYSASSL